MGDSDQVRVKVRVGSDLSIVVPSTLSEALGLKEGDVLFARVENGEIHLLTPAATARRAQAIVRQFVPKASVSLMNCLRIGGVKLKPKGKTIENVVPIHCQRNRISVDVGAEVAK
jgi:bifunctional DNA-binding transcriptional regulator/antitoxin component of YhaV-PrlF toxin-antitoxin module